MNPLRDLRATAAGLVQRLLPRNLGVLAGANLLSQLGSLVAMPLLTRWCSVTDFGFFQLYATTVTVLGLLACARFDQAILVPTDDAAARNLCYLSSLSAVAMGAAVFGLVHFLGPLSQSSWSMLADWAPLLGASVTVTGINTAITQWYIRTGRFSAVVRSRVAQSVGTIALQVGGAAAGFGSVPLIYGDAMGRLAGLIALVGLVQLPARLRTLPDRHLLLALARQYARFPLVSTPSALINAAGFSLPVILLERFYGAQAVGIFSLLERVMGIPTVLIGQPLSQLFCHGFRASLAKGAAAAVATIRQTARTAALLGAVPFAALLFAGPQLFELVFGLPWRTAGQLAQVLALPYFISFVLWPTMPALVMLNRLSPQLFWDVARAGGMFALLVAVGLSSRGSAFAISAVVTLMAAMYVVHFTLTVRAARRYEA
jgi:O-antigen/teichoic acid export membrane protein